MIAVNESLWYVLRLLLVNIAPPMPSGRRRLVPARDSDLREISAPVELSGYDRDQSPFFKAGSGSLMRISESSEIRLPAQR
jgi:hypothetical protein